MARLVTAPLVLAAALAVASFAEAQSVKGTSSAPGRPRAVPVVRPTEIGCGQVVEAYAPPGATLPFVFQGQADELVDLVMVEAMGFFGSFPQARVTAPSGTEVAILIGTELETLALAETGVYRIQVTAAAAGVFTLGLGCPSTGTPIVPGDVIAASLDDAGELDYYVFDGQPDDVVQLILVETGGFATSAPRGTLYSPNGSKLGTFDADSATLFTLPDAGDYFVRLQANDLTGTGIYSLGLGSLPPASAVPLNCGSPPQNASTSSPGEAEYFTFDGGVGHVVEVAIVSGGSSVPQARVYTPTGDLIATFTSDSIQPLVLAELGLYTIEVLPASLGQTGPFTIGVSCRDPIGPATSLSCGALVSGALAIGEVDYYTFSGIAADTAEITLVETSGFTGVAAPQLRVFTPSGGDLGAFTADSVNPISLPESGTYAVRVNSNTLIDAGTYDISLACLPPTGVVHVGDDSLTQATIVAAAEVDSYSFDGLVGEVVELTLVQTAGFSGTVARGTLFSPSGVNLGTFDANSLTEFTLPEAGSAAGADPYTVQVRAANLVSLGSYTLGVERRQAGPIVLFPNPQSPPLACGQLIAASISQPAEVDYFRFSASSGDLIELTLASSGFTAVGRLFSPSGVNLGGFNANSLSAFTLPETGLYVVRIVGNGYVGTGNYWLGLECRVPLGPVQAHLVCGDLVPETITTPAESDWYSFDASTGDIVELTLASSGFTAVVALYSPSGAYVGAFNANGLSAFPLPETGRYGVRVVGNSYAGTGSYWIGFECRVPLGPVQAHLACGDLVLETITTPAESDWYSFDASTGDIVELTLASSGFTAVVALYSPSGAYVGAFNANGLSAFTLPETGRYGIRIVGNSYAGTGTYWLGFECRVPLGPVQAHMVCGDLVAETIATPAESDWYSFDASSGDIIELTLASSGFTAVLRLFSPTGVALGGFNANGLSAFTLPETGRYGVRIVGNSYAGTGSYWLGFECRVPLGPVQAHLACGDIVTGTITTPSESDWYSFDASNGDTIELTLTSSGFTAVGRLFSPSGADLGGLNANGIKTFNLTETGRHAIRIVGNSYAGTGSYNLGLSCP